MAEISGVVNSIIYRNAENGWTVLELTPDEGDKLTVVGALPLASVGERVELVGDYASHPKYGCQFKATQYKTLAPATLSAIESYLGSGLIKGVGAATASSACNASACAKNTPTLGMWANCCMIGRQSANAILLNPRLGPCANRNASSAGSRRTGTSGQFAGRPAAAAA